MLLDERVVHERHFHVGVDPDRWSVPVRLTAGRHRVPFKVENWASGTGIFFGVAHADGTEAAEVVPTIGP